MPVDFANESDVSLVRDQLTSFVDRGITVRFGIVPLTQTRTAEGSTDQAKVVYHLAEKYGLQTMLGYLQSCLTAKKTARPDKEIFNDIVRDATLNMDDVSEEAPAVPTLEEVLTSEESKKRVALFRHWTKRMNADTEVPPAFIDGVAVPRNDNWLHAMSLQLATDLQLVQQAVFGGAIPTEEDSDDYFWIPSLFLERASQRRNPYIVPEDGKAPPVLDVHRLYADNAALLLSGAVPVIEASPDASSESWAALTVVADADSEPGQALLVAALRFRNNNPGVRLDIVHNPAVADGAHKVNSRLLAVSHEKLLEVDTVAELQTLLASSPAPPESDDGRYAAALTSFLASASLTPGARAVILNGRVVGHIAASDALGDDDLQHLLEFERAARILPVHGAAQQLGLADRALRDPLSAAKLTSVTALSTVSDLPEGIFESAPTLRMAGIFDQWNSTHTAFEVGDRDQASVHLVALLNPASEQGQRWAPILKVLSELDGVYLKVFLNPREQLDELPVKRFFRYVLESAPSFDAEGRVKRLRAHFAGLPREALLTAGMNTPPAWLVAAKKSVHDLDNIKLSSVAKGTNVDAVYELENILIEGHSRDEDRQAPRGAQLVLTTATEQQGRPPLADTIIMANLGYFQFKANPGVYRIDMKPGRSADIYHIESVGAKGYGPVPGDEGTEVALIDFQGATLYPRIRHKPGMEKENVLEPAATADKDKDKEGSILSKGLKLAEGLFGGGGGSAAPAKTKTSTSDEEHAEINIFSVASGHLYERMLNIMMVSVMKHTNHTVKFWFIEQFLSPSFKDFIPHLAAEYGFRYEMVTFKWPHWLRQQKEKQREIWGYKILFLDVLFPLSLDKVIFVDADQIVRTDMKELVDLDLEGAPYGFTPMCDSRTEMEGFRFWKTGYWKNYLKGLPYHISALYVVDLRRFRAMAAGDRLRQQYHSLSADPNSLANLDQDLPNHMQIVIPIKSLPQEWLWCETWCDDESLATARTIDLCNNPLTKEPKLDRARRQVPEWTVYDEEIAALDRRRREKKAVGTGDGGQKVLKEERAQSSSSSSSSSSAEQAKTRIKDEL